MISKGLGMEAKLATTGSLAQQAECITKQTKLSTNFCLVNSFTTIYAIYYLN